MSEVEKYEETRERGKGIPAVRKETRMLVSYRIWRKTTPTSQRHLPTIRIAQHPFYSTNSSRAIFTYAPQVHLHDDEQPIHERHRALFERK